MIEPYAPSRRIFLADLGRAGFAIAILGVAGCAAATPSSPSSPARSDGRAPDASAEGAEPCATPTGTPAPGSDAPSNGGGSGSVATTWQRVNLGFVSAYILVRGGEAAVVDTGVPGSEDAIGDALEAASLGWGSVGHVILTHQHQDHAGGAAAVLDAAPAASAYAGADDIPAIAVPRPLTAVADGDTVFGLRIVATPGHTRGHVAVLDEAGGILVAGDALRTSGGRPAAPSPEFTEDMDAALASVAKLGSLTFETLLVGHGEPIELGAAAQVKALAGG